MWADCGWGLILRERASQKEGTRVGCVISRVGSRGGGPDFDLKLTSCILRASLLKEFEI